MSVDYMTNEELMNELMKRDTFKGIIICQKGLHDNIQEGDGGVNIRISKGFQLQDLFSSLDITLIKLRERFTKAFDEYFQGKWNE